MKSAQVRMCYRAAIGGKRGKAWEKGRPGKNNAKWVREKAGENNKGPGKDKAKLSGGVWKRGCGPKLLISPHRRLRGTPANFPLPLSLSILPDSYPFTLSPSFHSSTCHYARPPHTWTRCRSLAAERIRRRVHRFDRQRASEPTAWNHRIHTYTSGLQKCCNEISVL